MIRAPRSRGAGTALASGGKLCVGLGVPFGIEDLLAQGCQPMVGRLFDVGKLGVNDGQCFGLGGDVGMLGLKLGD